jgi:hypothetical protein
MSGYWDHMLSIYMVYNKVSPLKYFINILKPKIKLTVGSSHFDYTGREMGKALETLAKYQPSPSSIEYRFWLISIL